MCRHIHSGRRFRGLSVCFLDDSAGFAQEKGQTEVFHFFPYLLSSVLAFIISRWIQPFLALVGREVEFDVYRGVDVTQSVCPCPTLPPRDFFQESDRVRHEVKYASSLAKAGSLAVRGIYWDSAMDVTSIQTAHGLMFPVRLHNSFLLEEACAFLLGAAWMLQCV